MDPNVPFSDTSARRAELMEATEQYKSRIENNVSSLKGDAGEVGKTVAIVAGVCVAVYLVASLVLPKDRDDDGEEEAYYDADADEYYPHHSQKAVTHRAAKAAEAAPKKSAISGAIMGILTSVATAYAKDQALKYVSRFTQNNASKQSNASGRQTQPATYQSVYP